MLSDTKTMSIKIPSDVPKLKQKEYARNFELITHGVGRIALFAGDQKVEHLNDDFIEPEASAESADPEHLFKIAAKSKISCFATQLGLLARYGQEYPKIPYILKLNSKTNIVPTASKDPLSLAMVTMEQVARFKKSSGLNIVGVGYTLYLGSEYEYQMMREAMHAIFEAHQLGMLSIIWMYPRGRNVTNERDPHLIAGATGVASCLGTDFVKVNFPKFADPAQNTAENRAKSLIEAVKAAGRTRVICSGGEKMSAEDFFQQLYDQIHISGTSGNATGRNIHERPLAEAVRFADAIYALTIRNATVQQAVKIYKG